MTRSPIFWFAAGVASVWAYHKFAGNKSMLGTK